MACWLWVASVQAQAINFRVAYKKANPVAPESTLATEEKVPIHRNFLEAATRSNDPEKRLYGFLYLHNDYAQMDDYAESARYLLEAENVARVSGNVDWQGWVSHRKGALYIQLKNYREALSHFEAAKTLCGQAGDSLCLAETLEQIGAVYSRLGDFEQSHLYCGLALPLIEKYGSDMQMANTLNNFANLLLEQHRFEEGIPYYERALALIRKLGDKKTEIIYLNNLASSYKGLGQFGIARKMLQQCAAVNLENAWLHSAIDNYAGLSQIYEETGDARLALDFFKKYHNLRDSIVGAETQEKIADLEAKYASQQQELELQKSQITLSETQSALERGTGLLVFLLLLVVFGVWRWRMQARHARQELAQNQAALTDLTHILLDKNTLLAALEEQVAAQPQHRDVPPTPADFEENLYNQRILTDADWAAFKVYFEKAYPGYLLRLRLAYPTLSDAEERLFLFVKLNLTTKEAALILGISAESVKKNRNRLRKRLGLSEEEDLETVVRAF